jgi:hypothetical protein
MERKPQQQTLSIRISDTLRDFLEESKGVIADARSEAVSISGLCAGIRLPSRLGGFLGGDLKLA